jgi:hypothetical protein
LESFITCAAAEVILLENYTFWQENAQYIIFRSNPLKALHVNRSKENPQIVSKESLLQDENCFHLCAAQEFIKHLIIHRIYPCVPQWILRKTGICVRRENKGRQDLLVPLN